LSDPTAILATIPGFEGARWRVLSGGTNRPVFRVSNGEREAVLKIGTDERGRPFNKFHEEAAVQSNAASAGLAPSVIHASAGAFLTEFVEGHSWRGQDFAHSSNLERLAVGLRCLHALPLCRRNFDARQAGRRYAARIDHSNNAMSATCLEVIENSSLPGELRCCHNDLVAANLLSTPDLLIIDWEYACDNDPYFDLATVIEHHELGDEAVVALMIAYTGDDSQAWREHLTEQRRLYLALLCLWLLQRPDSGTSEIERVAARLLTSCS
jgi:thiamine kinase-like enzyme